MSTIEAGVRCKIVGRDCRAFNPGLLHGKVRTVVSGEICRAMSIPDLLIALNTLRRHLHFMEPVEDPACRFFEGVGEESFLHTLYHRDVTPWRDRVEIFRLGYPNNAKEAFLNLFTLFVYTVMGLCSWRVNVIDDQAADCWFSGDSNPAPYPLCCDPLTTELPYV